MTAESLLHHRIEGPADAPPLILGPSLGTSLRVWEPQLPVLARSHRVLRFDLPGHGGSPADALGPVEPGAATVARLADLVLALADHHGLGRFAYAGISLGGAIGLHLAVHHPERVTSLALVCSSAHFGPAGGWHERADLVRGKGTEPLLDASAGRWFADAGTASETLGAALLADLRNAEPAGYAACCDALAGYDLREELPRVTAPTLVVAGRDDPATPPAHARELADGIPAADLVELSGAAHLAGVERPTELAAALGSHFASHGSHGPAAASGGTASGDEARHAAGMSVRRAVLGDAHVDRAVARTTAFTADFQDFITRYAWGDIWTRPGLERRIRSSITLTALVARGHHEELALHVRAALAIGLSRDEIKEVLLQSAIYCGVPAANSAFAVAQRVLDDIEGPA